jgi:hypothetical protein
MRPENVDIALAMARIAGKIRGQKCKAWVVKDLGIESLGQALIKYPHLLFSKSMLIL